MWIIIAAMLFWSGCGNDSSTAPIEEPLNTQIHTESDVAWNSDKMIAREITWSFISFEKDANGHPASIGRFGFTLANSDSIDKHISYDLHFLNASDNQIAVALYPYVPVDSLPLIKSDSIFTVNGFFQTSSIPSAALANSITRMKVFASFFAR